MQEQLISLKTAKLAKEKGFNIALLDQYYENGKITQDITKGEKLRGGDFYAVNNQSLLQKWLRDDEKIMVYAVPNGKDNEDFVVWDYMIWNNINGTRTDGKLVNKTYEEALEKGLQEALKLI